MQRISASTGFSYQPNPLNRDVFRGIASHDKFRHRVTEIIWDDARLVRGPRQTWDNFEGHELLSDEDEPGNMREWAEECHFYARECISERHQHEEEEGVLYGLRRPVRKTSSLLG